MRRLQCGMRIADCGMGEGLVRVDQLVLQFLYDAGTPQIACVPSLLRLKFPQPKASLPPWNHGFCDARNTCGSLIRLRP
jgi:hypothetical protein